MAASLRGERGQRNAAPQPRPACRIGCSQPALVARPAGSRGAPSRARCRNCAGGIPRGSLRRACRRSALLRPRSPGVASARGDPACPGRNPQNYRRSLRRSASRGRCSAAACSCGRRIPSGLPICRSAAAREPVSGALCPDRAGARPGYPGAAIPHRAGAASSVRPVGLVTVQPDAPPPFCLRPRPVAR
jgi:hypothetical protein